MRSGPVLEDHAEIALGGEPQPCRFAQACTALVAMTVPDERLSTQGGIG